MDSIYIVNWYKYNKLNLYNNKDAIICKPLKEYKSSLLKNINLNYTNGFKKSCIFNFNTKIEITVNFKHLSKH
jgi:hypothetical protein